MVENLEFCFGQEREAYDTFKKMSSNQPDRRIESFLDRSRLELQIWVSRAYSWNLNNGPRNHLGQLGKNAEV